MKKVKDFSGIWTKIALLEGELADHYTKAYLILFLFERPNKTKSGEGPLQRRICYRLDTNLRWHISKKWIEFNFKDTLC